MKFCKDCKHFGASYCHAPELAAIKIVTGPEPRWAEYARDTCGRDNPEHFEPRFIKRTFEKLKGLLS